MVNLNMPTFFKRPVPSTSEKNIFSELFRLQKQLDHFMEDLSVNSESLSSAAPIEFSSGCEVEETDSHYLLSYDLPGVKKEDIKITLQDHQLVVSGERKEKVKEQSDGSWSRKSGSFERRIMLPIGVTAEQIEADHHDGVLRVAVPKTEASRPHSVAIGEGRAGFWERILGHKKEDTKKATEKAA
jgi:HSP20 family protein